MTSYLGSLDHKKAIRIYGAGISGLVSGYYAKKAGFNVEIYERTKQSGGLIQTHELQHGSCDSAAHTILVNQNVLKLLEEIELSPIYFPSSAKRLISRSGYEFQTLPFSLLEIPQFAVTSLKKIPEDLFKDDLTVYDFFKSWCGPKITDEVVTTALRGIYASHANELHFASIFPMFKKGDRYLTWLKRLIKQLAQDKKKPATFKKGIGELTAKLSEILHDSISYESSPAIDTNYNNIITTNAIDAAKLLPHLSKSLNQIHYKELSKVTLHCQEEITELKGCFGALISPLSSYKSMGILSNSYLNPHCVNGSLEVHQYSFICHSRDDFEHDKDKLQINHILEDTQNFYTHAIPIYNYNRFKQIENIRASLSQSTGEILFGNYTGSLSLRKIIEDAQLFF